MFYFLIYIIVLFFILMSVFKRSGNSIKRTSSISIFFFIVASVFLIIMIYPVIKSSINIDENKEVEPADGFNISKYTVKLDVKEDNIIDVEEDITINWLEYGHHGIYKFTPEWYKYTSKNGKTIRRKSELSNLRAEAPEYTYNPDIYYNDNEGVEYTNDEYRSKIAYSKSYNYSLDKVKDKPRIKIGNSSVALSPGEKDYIIKYTYNQGSDPYKGYDEFIFHVYGDYWGTRINNPSLEITMPKSIEGMKVHFFMDKYRKYDVTEFVDYTITNNKLVASFDRNKYGNTRPVGYPYELTKSLTVDIELPDNYFVNGTNNYGVISLTCIIVCLFNLLIIFIFWLIFGKDHRSKTEVVTYLPPRDLSSAELGYLYSNGFSKKYVASTIIELAYKKFISIREEDKVIYIKSLKPKEIKEEDGLSKKTIAEINKVIEDYNAEKAKLSSCEQIVLDKLENEYEETKLKSCFSLYTAYDKMQKELENKYDREINERTGLVLRIIGIVLVCISALLMRFAYSTVQDLPQSIYFMYYVGFISVLVMLFLCAIMTRRSVFGEEIKTEISGFKKFLLTVEKNKLEELVEEMPHYFYQILPFTYVLNISKKWIEKFNDIPIPQEEINMTNYDVLDSISDNIYYPVSSGSSGGSSSSSCGGGCSSCGGGCSSCGGGGSW